MNAGWGIYVEQSLRFQKKNIKSHSILQAKTSFEFCRAHDLQDVTGASFPPSRPFLAALPYYYFSIYVLFPFPSSLPHFPLSVFTVL